MGMKAASDRLVQDASMYVRVEASQTTAQISRAGSAAGDYLESVIVIPASSAAGAITIFDGASTVAAIPAMISGATQTLDALYPQRVELGITSATSKGFNITTGANVAVVAVGRFDH